MRAVQVARFGGPEVLHVTEVDEPRPGEDEVVIEVDAAGINFADTHQSENDYLAPQQLPFVPGGEVVGRAVSGDHSGRRVVALTRSGGYAELAVARTDHVWPVPEAVPDGAALGLVLQGTTAWHLLRTCAHLAPGETVVVHAAAGGVGTLAVQLARHWSAGRVIGVASAEAKRALATELGADATVGLAETPTAVEVRHALVSANEGRPVDVVLEMTGGTVFDGSLSALAPLGRLVTYGMASRRPPQRIDPLRLTRASRAVIGFWLVHVAAVPGGLDGAMHELLDLAADGRLRVVVGGTYPLEEAGRAHEDLLARRTVGKLVLRAR
jgi:NADPH2:quinone reductase